MTRTASSTPMAVAVAAAVALVAVCALVAPAAGKALNENVMHYEGVTISPADVMRQGRYTRSLYRHDRPFSFKMAAYSKEFTFDVAPNDDLFTHTFHVAVFDGSRRTEMPMNDRTYYTGTVNGDPKSRCHFRVANDGSVHGDFHHDGESYKVDPVEYHNIDEEEKQKGVNHVVYTLSDHVNGDLNLPAHCGAQPPLPPTEDEGEETAHARSRRAPFSSSNTVCDVAFISDSKWFTSVGDADLGRTIDLMTSRFDSVRALYHDTNDVVDTGTGAKIDIRIGYLEVQTDTGNDPYNPMNFNGDGNAYLRHISTDPNRSNAGVRWDDYCVVHMLTYQDFDNGLLGLAWTGSTTSPGGICQAEFFTDGAQRTLNSGFSTQINFGSDVSSLTAYLVMAHELGHNFGSLHDEASGSVNGEFLMFPVSVDGSDSNNFRFSAESLDMIGDVITARGGCFIASDTDSCGNTVQEGMEECDCGKSEDLCSNVDACCTTSCTLDGSAQCSPRHSQNGACCTNDCMLITSGECRAESACKEASSCDMSGECPLAADKDDYLTCTETHSKVCASGECDTSICGGWDLSEDLSMIGTCVIFCDDAGTSKNTTALGAPAHTLLNATDGMSLDISMPLYRAPGESCRFSASEAGVCNSNQVCERADTSIFDRIADFLNSIDFGAIRDWFLRTDAYIPNYGWVAAGVGVLALLITLCCCCSNKLDKKREKKLNRVV